MANDAWLATAEWAYHRRTVRCPRPSSRLVVAGAVLAGLILTACSASSQSGDRTLPPLYQSATSTIVPSSTTLPASTTSIVAVAPPVPAQTTVVVASATTTIPASTTVPVTTVPVTTVATSVPPTTLATTTTVGVGNPRATKVSVRLEPRGADLSTVPSGQPKVCVVWNYEGVEANASYFVAWTLNGQRYFPRSDPSYTWSLGGTGIGANWCIGVGNGLAPNTAAVPDGTWEWQWYVGGKLVATKPFTVGGG